MFYLRVALASPLIGFYCAVAAGVCIRCLYNTTGDHCERCLDGYQRDAQGGRGCTQYGKLGVGSFCSQVSVYKLGPSIKYVRRFTCYSAPTSFCM